MNIILWILQAGLCIKGTTTIFTHIIKHAPAYGNRPLMILISIILFVGSAGLIIPGIFKVITWIIPFAAALYAVLMIVSLVFHAKCPEHTTFYVDIVLFVVAVFVAIGRRFISPL